MAPSNPSIPAELPELPRDCPEIRATKKPGEETLLEEYLPQLPGLDRDRFNRLATLAFRAQGGGYGYGPGTTVLGLSDLFRQPSPGGMSLHPRLTHLVPLGDLDPLLEKIAEILDWDHVPTACQYPGHLLECRGNTPDIEALYPPEYSLQVADIMRMFREHYILTSVRRPGQSYLDPETIQATVDTMDGDGEIVAGAITLHQPTDKLEPALYLDDCSNQSNPQTEEDLIGMVDFFSHRHNLSIDWVEYTEWRGDT